MHDEALDATLALPIALPRVGATFAGRYRIVEALGAGGMGAVYRAHDLELDEDVALKVLRAGLADDADALARFRREVKLARRVTHVNVARTYDLGLHEGAIFLTMERIEGAPLSRRLAAGPCTLAEALRVGCEIARGLTAAHAVEVVHRDLKPENVMVSDARVVITDFGIARSAAFDGEAGATSGLIGTPAYMAPEQVEGCALDGRTDVYALGVLLFEALAGRLPFEGSTPLGTAAMRLTTAPPDPRTYSPRIPAAIAELILAMLSRSREARPAAQSVLARLEALRGSAPPLAPRLPELPAARVITLRVAAASSADERERALASELVGALEEHACTLEGVALANSDADLALSLSARVRGDRARVRLRLEDRDGAALFVGSADGTIEAELDLEDAVVAVARGALARHASPAGHGSQAPRSVAREPRTERHSMLDPDAIDRSLEALEEDAARAPDDASAQGALAFLLARRWVIADARRSPDDLARAEELCYRALASDPSHPDALQALGMLRYVTGDMRGAARAMREALSRSPHLVEANVYLARLLEESAHPTLARERWELVEQRDPGRVEPALFRMREAGFAGDLATVDREAIACRVRPGGARYALLARARFVMWWGDRERAREVLAEVRSVESPIARGTLIPMMSLVLGERTLELDWVEAQFRSHERANSRRMAAFGCQMATEVLLAQGDGERALGYLEAGAALPLIDVAWMDRCPLLAPIRGEPRFAAARAMVTARVDDMWS